MPWGASRPLWPPVAKALTPLRSGRPVPAPWMPSTTRQHVPFPAGLARAGQIQLQAVLEADPGNRQDPGPVRTNRMSLASKSRPAVGGVAVPARQPVALPERHFAEGDAPGAEGLPGQDVAGELAQGRQHLVPGLPGKALGHGQQARGGVGREGDVLGLPVHDAGRRLPQGRGNAQDILVPAQLPGPVLLVEEVLHGPRHGPGHGSVGAVHQPEMIRDPGGRGPG